MSRKQKYHEYKKIIIDDYNSINYSENDKIEEKEKILSIHVYRHNLCKNISDILSKYKNTLTFTIHSKMENYEGNTISIYDHLISSEDKKCNIDNKCLYDINLEQDKYNLFFSEYCDFILHSNIMFINIVSNPFNTNKKLGNIYNCHIKDKSFLLLFNDNKNTSKEIIKTIPKNITKIKIIHFNLEYLDFINNLPLNLQELEMSIIVYLNNFDEIFDILFTKITNLPSSLKIFNIYLKLDFYLEDYKLMIKNKHMKLPFGCSFNIIYIDENFNKYHDTIPNEDDTYYYHCSWCGMCICCCYCSGSGY
jgi:hypothetical protein